VVLCLRLGGGAGAGSLAFFIPLCWITVLLLMASSLGAMAYFIRRTRSDTLMGRAVPTFHGDSVETTSS
jgi:hypothetical protein